MLNLNALPAQFGAFLDRLPSATRQTGYLVAIDSLTNLVDYGFHVYLGRALLPAEFAVVQTINAVLLVVVTGFSVMEPVIARQIVEVDVGQGLNLARAGAPAHWPAIFQSAWRLNAVLGVFLFAVVWLNRQAIAGWLQVPLEVISIAAFVLLFALPRPVISGTLQGQRRFVAFGLTRSIYALGRLAVAVLLVSVGAGLLGVVAAFPLGSALAVLGGLGLLGAAAWKAGGPAPDRLLARTIRLSAAAFIAYTGYMSLLNSDLLWINRAFSPALAGNYAAAVFLRRVLLLLPGAVIVVMYPRAVKQFTENRLPDRLLINSAAAIFALLSSLTALYFLFGSAIVRLVFGPGYESAGPVLGWMGLGVIGYSLTALWMNFYLATRPLPFVLLLGLSAVAQHLLLASFHASPTQVVAIFVIGGWFLALAGLLLYLGWFRRTVRAAST